MKSTKTLVLEILKLYVYLTYTALECAGFEQLVKDNDDLVLEDDSRCFLTCKTESDISFKVIGPKRTRPILPVCNLSEESSVFSSFNVILKYFDLFDSLIELLQFKETNEALTNLIASETFHIKLFSPDFVKYLRGCTNTVLLLRVLFPYTNWYDHSILRWLLQACNCSEGLKLLDEYNAQIDFALPIKDYPLPIYQPSYMTPDVSSTHTMLAIRCEQQLSSLKLKHIGKVKSILLQVFDITEYACILLTATNTSSAILYWLIPQSIVPYIYSKVKEYSRYLHDNKILEIAVYPNFAFSTGNVDRIWSLAYYSDTASAPTHVSAYLQVLMYVLHWPTYMILEFLFSCI